MILGAGMAGSYSTILMFVVFIALMYFMMIRPQKKQQEKRQEMMNGLKKGDSVVTIGGLHGVVDEVNKAEQTVTLDCDGIYLVFNLAAVGRVVPAKTETKSVVEPEVEDNSKTTTDDADEAETKEEK